jgi:hypothetical protein
MARIINDEDILEVTPSEVSPEEMDLTQAVGDEDLLQETVAPVAKSAPKRKFVAEMPEKNLLEKGADLLESGINATEQFFDESVAGPLEAATRGAIQEAAFEGADEAEAQIRSRLTGRSVEELLPEIQAEYEEMQKKYPGWTLTGGLVGGVAQGAALAPLTAGVGTAGSIARLASKIPKAAQIIKGAQAVGKTVPTLAKVAKGGAKIAGAATRGAAAGAVQGAAYEAGRVKTDITPEDLARGAKSGALLGGTLSGAGKTAGTLYDAAKSSLAETIARGETSQFGDIVLKAIKAGKEGRGFVAQKDTARLLDVPYEIAKNTRTSMVNTLDDLRRVKDFIIDNTDGEINLKDPLNGLKKSLMQEGYPVDKAKDIINVVSGILNKTKNEAGENIVSLAEVNKVAKRLDELRFSDPNLPVDIQDSLKQTKDLLANMIDTSIDDAQALRVVANDPKMLNIYRKFVAETPQDELQNMLKKKMAVFLGEGVSEKDVNKLVASVNKGVQNLKSKNIDVQNPEKLQLALIKAEKEAKQNLDTIIQSSSPMSILNSKSNKIMTASEILGNIHQGRRPEDTLKDIETLYRTLLNQPKDTVAGKIAREKYVQAMQNLEQALPEVKAQLEKDLKPILGDIEVFRYMQGGTIEPNLREKGISRKLTDLPVEIPNVIAQIGAAAKKGVKGPIPYLPTTTLVSPDTSVLRTIKDTMDNDPVVGNSPVMKYMSNYLSQAIEQKDEMRRMAILNTLMSYAPFRKYMEELSGNQPKSEQKE